MFTLSNFLLMMSPVYVTMFVIFYGACSRKHSFTAVYEGEDF
jgi:hypothetical protein